MLTGWRRLFSGLVVLVLIASQAAMAQDTRELEGRLQRVALFKNGLGYLTIEAPLPEGVEGAVRLKPFLAPSLGTFWVSYPEDVELESLVAREAVSEHEVPAASLAELLRANVGKRVRLYRPAGEDVWLEGELISIAKDRARPESSPYSALHSYGRPRPGVIRGQLAMLRTERGTVAFDPSAIDRADFPDSGINDSFNRSEKTVELVARLEEPSFGKSIQASYLAKGITWAPSYLVAAGSDGKATISAKALIVNEAADLDQVSVDLVTGFPHLYFSDVISPIALKQSLSQLFASLDRDRGSVSRRRRFVGQIGGAYAVAAREEAALPDYGAAEVGASVEDLFLYPLGSVTLARGETGYFPLFSDSVPCEHIYRWHIPNHLDEQERYARKDEDEDDTEVVWHSLRLENTTRVPWTTGPAQTVQNGQILGQDVLAFTPKGAEQTLRVTHAISVKAEEMEREVERKRNAKRFYGRSYDLVTIRGALQVTNAKRKRIELEIVKTLSGDIVSVELEPQVETLARGLRSVNPLRRLTWLVELSPGQSRRIEYVYKVLVWR